jgi:uncharacterized membrane protein (TIGR02234 family)
MSGDGRDAGAASGAGTAASAGGRRGRPWSGRPWSGRRELTAIVLLGAIGAGVVLLALRPGWAQVRTNLPAPLPDSVISTTGQSLVPWVEAMGVAALASLAAVLATRGVARRVAGVLLAAMGVGIIAGALAGVTVSAARAAADSSASPGTGTGAASVAGSATEGSTSGSSAVTDIAGFHSRVVLTAVGWQALAVTGALAVIAAGLLVVWRARRLPVMSSRYDSPSGAPALARASAPPPPAATVAAQAIGPEPAAPDSARPGPDSATMWEALSRGEDPTAARRA